MSHNNHDPLKLLVADLRPVQPMHFHRGMALYAVAAAVTLAAAGSALGWRADIMSAQFHALWLLANGLFLLLAVAAASGAVAMASPQVGQNVQGWKWAAATAALLPLTVLVLLAADTLDVPAQWASTTDFHCLEMGVGLGVLVAVALTFWLRRGAPASPNRAGLLVGIASGSTGILIFAFSCPSDSLYHIGLWHTASVGVGAVLGRLLIPRLVRW